MAERLRIQASVGYDARKRPRYTLILVAAVLALAGCATPTASHGNATPTAPAIAQSQGRMYLFSSASASNGPPNTSVIALGLGDGRQLWHTQLSGSGAGATLAGGTLYVGAIQEGSALPQGALQALDANTGAPLWHYAPPSKVVVPLAANASIVITDVITAPSPESPPSSALMALSARDGSPQWTTPLGGESVLATQGDGTLYLFNLILPTQIGTTSPQADLLAASMASGKVLWHDALPGVPFGNAAPVLSGGSIYLATQSATGGSIVAVRASDGMVLWSKPPVNGTADGQVVVAGGSVCYTYQLSNGPGGGIVGLHTADGSVSWQAATQGGGPDPIAADGTAIYVLDTTKSINLATTLLAFDASTGQAKPMHLFPTLSGIQVQFGVGTSFRVVDGVLYAAGSGVALPLSTATTGPQVASIVLALNARDGSAVWQRQISGNVGPVVLFGP